ncbi:MAG: methylated-DNA--[protein]-cysteine S-methyltransferase [Acidimicrobiia bacterium]|nr:methylated-DNA--[protein]-cysteine S-methyltransferase [Acidimicrobiia bacterium]
MTLEHDLADLRVAAPPHLLDGALARAGLVDAYVVRPSPLGDLYVVFGPDGIRAVDLAEGPGAFEAAYSERTGRDVVPAPGPPVALGRLDRALTRGRPGDLPVDLTDLTDFQRAVLDVTAGIPAGEVRPYGWVAAEVGSPGATRAVGSALARNPVPVLVPCHRVVRSDGRIGNYSLGGPDNKRALLDAEGVDREAYETLADRGVRYVGSDTTGIACLPTCHAARRITDAHRVEFRSAAAATAAGYRACRHCRPKLAAA